MFWYMLRLVCISASCSCCRRRQNVISLTGHAGAKILVSDLDDLKEHYRIGNEKNLAKITELHTNSQGLIMMIVENIP